MDLRHATTPLLGEATNPIDATIADAGAGARAAAKSGVPRRGPLMSYHATEALMDRRVHAHRGARPA